MPGEEVADLALDPSEEPDEKCADLTFDPDEVPGEEGADIGDMDEGEEPQIPHDDFID